MPACNYCQRPTGAKTYAGVTTCPGCVRQNTSTSGDSRRSSNNVDGKAPEYRGLSAATRQQLREALRKGEEWIHPVRFAPPVTWPSVSAVPTVTINDRPGTVRATVPQSVQDCHLFRQLLSLHRLYLDCCEPDGARLASLAMAGDLPAGEALVRRLMDAQESDRAERLAHGLVTEHGADAVQPFVSELAYRFCDISF